VTESFATLRVRTVLREARPADLLVELSAEAGLVVVGRGDRSPLERFMLGSNARRVADRAHCSVVVVSDEVLSTTGPIVAGVSPSDNGRFALQAACDEARVRGAELIAIRSWPDFTWAISGLEFPLVTPLAGVQEAQQHVLDEAIAEV